MRTGLGGKPTRRDKSAEIQRQTLGVDTSGSQGEGLLSPAKNIASLGTSTHSTRAASPVKWKSDVFPKITQQKQRLPSPPPSIETTQTRVIRREARKSLIKITQVDEKVEGEKKTRTGASDTSESYFY
ncbi:hypothetical protein CHS0354_039753 [Potamilus streckersoni]|uniref:Uncharacterized protein n=1 Tax=Potamilus streckersoni TaxID=2493646 RepID=A0AAE0RZY0_9BIVA|nr:hypothetical protein CHS0354_039753 [Potamilus streckersoni]